MNFIKKKKLSELFSLDSHQKFSWHPLDNLDIFLAMFHNFFKFQSFNGPPFYENINFFYMLENIIVQHYSRVLIPKQETHIIFWICVTQFIEFYKLISQEIIPEHVL